MKDNGQKLKELIAEIVQLKNRNVLLTTENRILKEKLAQIFTNYEKALAKLSTKVN